MAKYVIELDNRSGKSSISCSEAGILMRIALHCPKSWGVQSCGYGTGLKSDKKLTIKNIQAVVNDALNPDVIEVKELTK